MFNQKLKTMKIKVLLLATLFAFGFLAVHAQNVQKGDKVLNLGIGLGNALYSGSYYKSSVPPISASLEVVAKDGLFDGKGALGIGGYLGYAAYKWEYSGWGYTYTNIIIGPRGYIHYSFMDKLDTYAGLLIGYNIISAKEFGTSSGYDYSSSSSGLIWSGFIGGRYYFSDKFAVMLELGSGITYLNIGIALKL
jgi:hypothetical protein